MATPSDFIELQPFTEADFTTFKSWIQSKEELFQFAGPLLTFPVTDQQLRAYLQMADKKPFKVVLTTTQAAIGHCELNFENGNRRLSRILIADKAYRGKKLGEQVVRKMVSLLFQDASINEVDLNTFAWNKQAIRCYEKVGFSIKPENSEVLTVHGQRWTKINMSLKRENFRAF